MNNKKLIITIGTVATVVATVVTLLIVRSTKKSISDECEGCTGCDMDCEDGFCDECSNTECCCHPEKMEHILDM